MAMIVECPTCGMRDRLPTRPTGAVLIRCTSCKGIIELPTDLPNDEEEMSSATSAPGPGVWERAYSGEQEAALIEERPFSVKRMLGAALFGCLLTGYAAKACDYTMPTIISMIQGINEVTATEQYSASAVFPFLTLAFGAVLGSGVAAFLARKHAVLTGLLAGLPFALLFLTLTVLAVTRGDALLVGNISYELYTFLLFATIIVASATGGFIAQRASFGTWDPDLKQTKVTIFGVRWAHYFWILPLVVYPYLASLIMAVTSSNLSRRGPEVPFWDMRWGCPRRRRRVLLTQPVSVTGVSRDRSGCWTEGLLSTGMAAVPNTPAFSHPRMSLGNRYRICGSPFFEY